MTMIHERIYQEEIQVALRDLKLDPDNVRLRHNNSLLNEKQMEEWLLEEEDVKLLIRQIIRDRKIQQPIYVVRDEDGKYIVKEGNRRTVALREIDCGIKSGKMMGFEPDHFEVVPVFVLKGTAQQIKVFLRRQATRSSSLQWKIPRS